jgi:DNA-binding MarR family transcriptional regulator
VNVRDLAGAVNRTAENAELDRLLGIHENPDEADEPTLSALGLLLTGAIADGDVQALDLALDDMQRLVSLWTREDDRSAGAEQRGILLGLMEMVRWSLERAVPTEADLELDERDRPEVERFLRAVEAEPRCSNEAIGEALGLSKWQVTRIGNEIADRGLARRRKVGRSNEWFLTAKGLSYLEARPEPDSNSAGELVKLVFEALTQSQLPHEALSDTARERLEPLREELRELGGDVEIHDVVSEGDVAVCRFAVSGEQEGKPVEEVWRAEIEDGRIVAVESLPTPGTRRVTDRAAELRHRRSTARRDRGESMRVTEADWAYRSARPGGLDRTGLAVSVSMLGDLFAEWPTRDPSESVLSKHEADTGKPVIRELAPAGASS